MTQKQTKQIQNIANHIASIIESAEKVGSTESPISDGCLHIKLFKRGENQSIYIACLGDGLFFTVMLDAEKIRAAENKVEYIASKIEAWNQE